MKTYVIADSHGYYGVFSRALDEIQKREKGKVVFTGDYVDRGPASCAIIQRLIDGPPEGWEWVVIGGNHEDVFMRFLETPSIWPYYRDIGGGQTLMSYGAKGGMNVRDAARLVPATHRDFITNLPLWHIDEHRIYVHAYMPPHVRPEKVDKEVLIWDLYGPSDDWPWMDNGEAKHIVHGHHAHPYPILKQHRTDLDIGVYHTEKLAVGVFDGPGGPVEIIEVE